MSCGARNGLSGITGRKGKLAHIYTRALSHTHRSVGNVHAEMYGVSLWLYNTIWSSGSEKGTACMYSVCTHGSLMGKTKHS